MLQLVKNKLKDQRGFTLIELLAVIVILGIIAAIAVPSILGLIDNSKKDAHVANAQQMISSAKMAIASDSSYQDTQGAAKYITLSELESKNYLDTVDSPDSEAYAKGSTLTSDSTAVSYVRIVDGKITGIRLQTSKRGIAKYVTSGSISSKDISRADVLAVTSLPSAQ